MLACLSALCRGFLEFSIELCRLPLCTCSTRDFYSKEIGLSCSLLFSTWLCLLCKGTRWASLWRDALARKSLMQAPLTQQTRLLGMPPASAAPWPAS